MPDNKDEVLLATSERDEAGRPIVRPRLTHTVDQRDKVLLADPPAVIPIVFLPGIMGTNLKSKESGDSVWRAPNTDGFFPILGAIGQLFGYWFRGAATRQRRLDPAKVEVDDNGPIDAEGTITDELAKQRGWGTVMRSAYNPVMALLQKRLGNVMEAGEPLEWWRDEGMRSPDAYGEQQGGNAALGQAELRAAARYRFDVWAGGYNWLQSNRQSGQDIIDYIDNKVLAHYRQQKIPAEKVVLVTHSMGGLVARSVACIQGYANLLGVVHGVMPATGAAATYHHCRAGYDGVSSVILGRDAAEVVAILGNSPGGLELLPAMDYCDGKPWLKLGDPFTPNSEELPKAGDPYAEIYTNPAWYGLVPEENTPLLDPAGLNPAAAGETELEGPPAPGKRSLFERNIDDVAAFHRELSGCYHKPSFVHYGSDAGQKSWSELRWAGQLPDAWDSLRITQDKGKGTMEVAGQRGSASLEIADPADPGDGTVPDTSGGAPAAAGVQASFRQGDLGQGEFASRTGKGKAEGYEHQSSYNDVRSQWATLYGVAQCAQHADWA